jgi:hypothetical protein
MGLPRAAFPTITPDWIVQVEEESLQREPLQQWSIQKLAPQDFNVDDMPISIKVPFKLFVNGKEWQGHTIG